MACNFTASYQTLADSTTLAHGTPESHVQNRPGFVGPDVSYTATSVKDLIANAHDGMKVKLSGRIIKRISHDKYTFSDVVGDNTEGVVVDIDDKKMPLHEQITPDTTVIIYGEVDKSLVPSKIKIKAKKVEIAQPKTNRPEVGE